MVTFMQGKSEMKFLVARLSICLDHKTLLLETSRHVTMLRKLFLVYSDLNFFHRA